MNNHKVLRVLYESDEQIANYLATELTKHHGEYYTVAPYVTTLGYYKVTNQFDPHIRMVNDLGFSLINGTPKIDGFSVRAETSTPKQKIQHLISNALKVSSNKLPAINPCYFTELQGLMKEEYPSFSAWGRLWAIINYDRRIAQYKEQQKALALEILADMKNHTNNEGKANDNG